MRKDLCFVYSSLKIIFISNTEISGDDLEDKPKPGHAEVFIDRDDELLKVIISSIFV